MFMNCRWLVAGWKLGGKNAFFLIFLRFFAFFYDFCVKSFKNFQKNMKKNA